MRASFLLALVCAILFVGCGRKHVARRQLPPPPMPRQGTAASSSGERGKVPPAEPNQPGVTERDAEKDYARVRPIYTETGIASWYGTVYHHRKAANGEIYDQDGLTAAHKTLPLNSIVRVTNLSNDKSVVVRITDRGPFVGDRVIDLSLGAAKIIGLYLPGTARVRVDVLESPKDIATGGRWCVQIGAFDSYEKAAELKEKLVQRYRTAKVLQFTGPTGEWLRVRVRDDDKQRAYDVAKQTKAPEGVFVVRLD